MYSLAKPQSKRGLYGASLISVLSVPPRDKNSLGLTFGTSFGNVKIFSVIGKVFYLFGFQHHTSLRMYGYGFVLVFSRQISCVLP